MLLSKASMYPIDLLRQYLLTLDEVQLCELLDISAEDLVNKFGAKIRERRHLLEREVEFFPGSEGAEDFTESDYNEEDDMETDYDSF